ncbi:MAG: Tim44/TimA family putative adaptor protein [Pseudomonadota bacterium]
MQLDLFTLLPLAAAIFVFWKLRSVLGSRDGAEPPAMPTDMGGDNVVTLPGAYREPEDVPARDPEALKAIIEKHAGKDKDLRDGLNAIAARDPSFDPNEFLSGAKMAYEMIVTNFADGDKRALKGLLAPDVYENFADAIDERKARGESVRSTFVGIEKAVLSGAELVRDEEQVTVSFTSQIISATLDKDDEVVDGDLQEVAEVTDVWTFSKPADSDDPNWKLVATDA